MGLTADGKKYTISKRATAPRRKTVRVITGTARGRKLNTLEGRDVRPTTDQVKEAMFSIIQF